MSRRTIVALAVVATLLLVGLGWWAWRAPLVPALIFSARVARPSRVDVGSTLTGRVREVLVAEGQQLRRGEALVRLEGDELVAALEQARASERQAAARLAGLRSTGRSAAQAGVTQAESVLVAARA